MDWTGHDMYDDMQNGDMDIDMGMDIRSLHREVENENEMGESEVRFLGSRLPSCPYQVFLSWPRISQP